MNIKISNPFTKEKHDIDVDSGGAIFFFANNEKTQSAILGIVPNTEPLSWIGDFNTGVEMVKGKNIKIM